MNELLSNAASYLIDRRRDPNALAVRLSGLDLPQEAYEVQDRIAALLGAKQVGWKASLLSDGTVLSAPIFDCDTFLSGDVLAIEGRMRDGVECELAFFVNCDLETRPVGGYTRSDVKPCIGAVAAAFEMLNSRLID
ncbi:hypothetical protein EOA33_22380 [Mesorhizobium sp. M4A.F.Ca.ET.050.02.1.1]|uniref:hypothetical protein n=1 Tax=Mesorhizobium sp. M4A.F.Ca.ET.050.02.1.1 TaxID=2496754 RepID=UPI000FCA1A45|nr:hypothetical protein [Mesorhizobium sp. M4A.F.Ca.ET.050.02.1.1]RUX46039.1 hypothetical protein EOA33_22380 [Mesorhizobium sp. M4A.F.Ca.ET.050.02.1.1]